jgi:hypothetical protein
MGGERKPAFVQEIMFFGNDILKSMFNYSGVVGCKPSNPTLLFHHKTCESPEIRLMFSQTLQ